tara:strand:- start:3592 stop:4383 length:792 start_codon:yes stop_codon:yes gene_type:complete
MFDYIKNKYNPSPWLFLQNDLKKDYIYIPYVEAPFLILPATKDEFKALHKRKFWYNIRRSQKLFEKEYGDLNFDILQTEDKLNYYLDEVFILFKKRWSDEYTSAAWKSFDGFELYKKAMIDLASANESFLAVLTDKDGKLLSHGYCLVQDQTVCFYQHTTVVDDIYRKYSLGKILVYHLLNYSIDCNYIEFDFMSGQSSYKYEWAKNERMTYRQIGKKNIPNYFKSYFFKLRYFFQFNYYCRVVLKPIMFFLEKIHEKFKVCN